MSLDIRIPIGLLFAIIGVLLAVFGLASDPAIYARSLEINVNLWWGLALMAFGLGMLAVPRRSPGELRAILFLVSLVALSGIGFGAYLVVVPQNATQYTDVFGQRWPAPPEKGSTADVYEAHGLATRDGQRIGQWTAYWPKKGGDHEGQPQIREQGEYAWDESGIGTAKDGIWRQWDREGNLVGRCEFKPVLAERSKPLMHCGLTGVESLLIPRYLIAPKPDAVESLPVKGWLAFFAADGKLVRIQVYGVARIEEGNELFPTLFPSEVHPDDPDFQKTLDALRAADESEPACCP